MGLSEVPWSFFPEDNKSSLFIGFRCYEVTILRSEAVALATHFFVGIILYYTVPDQELSKAQTLLKYSPSASLLLYDRLWLMQLRNDTCPFQSKKRAILTLPSSLSSRDLLIFILICVS